MSRAGPIALLVALLVAQLAAGCSEDGAPTGRVRLATTTSTESSGLLADILPPFEREEGIEVQVIAAGTGQALELGRRGDADIVLVHARTLEDEFVARGQGIDRRDIMWNDFVILGPPSDPAGPAAPSPPACSRRGSWSWRTPSPSGPASCCGRRGWCSGR